MPEAITAAQFADSFGTSVEGLGARCRAMITGTDFRYRVIVGEERDQIILDVLKGTEADHQRIASPERKDVWERGWAENLEAFVASQGDPGTLIPKFIRPGRIIRFRGQYIKPSNPNFELDYFKVFRLWLFQTFLFDASAIYEFGCGTGFNLVAASELFPGVPLVGLDFVKASRDLVNRIGAIRQLPLTGRLFDMTQPDEDLTLPRDTAVLTMGSIEQLGGKFEEFLQFLLKRSPKICIHLEPTIELYDSDKLLDFLAIRFHRQRGYTENYLTRLRELQQQGTVEIVKVKRLFCGSLFMEGFSYIVWRPRITSKSRG